MRREDITEKFSHLKKAILAKYLKTFSLTKFPNKAKNENRKTSILKISDFS